MEAVCLLVEGASCPGASCPGVEGVPLEVEGGRRGGREVCRGIPVVVGRVAEVQTQMLQREKEEMFNYCFAKISSWIKSKKKNIR